MTKVYQDYDRIGRLFYNRLIKRYKHLRKYAKRCGIFAYRIYDKDIPEIPAAVDVYTEHATGKRYAVLTYYESGRYIRMPEEAASFIEELTKQTGAVLDIELEQICIKHRKRQRGTAQYEKLAEIKKEIIVQEGTCLFKVNLSDYLDTGLFLDHRPTRLLIGKTASGKKILNLFCYTGAFSVHALRGGAQHVCSVDLSKKYLQWAADNAALNGVYDSARAHFEQSDVRVFLHTAWKQKKKWDIIICDPPTFSNSKRTVQFFDINRDWAPLIQECCRVLENNGVLYFSTNSRTLTFSQEELGEPVNTHQFHYDTRIYTIKDITEQSIPEDFRNKKIHRLWEITHTQPV
ncbi:MAG: class I SAM-dependent methyltransferase [Treponema sp.]